MAKWEQIKPDLRKIFGETPLSGTCTGREGDLLIASIKGLPRSEGGISDGRVSPAIGGQYVYHSGHRTFMIFYLNTALRKLHPQQYPRIDLMPEFIWRIKEKAAGSFIGVSH
jgi:hypothetical protein